MGRIVRWARTAEKKLECHRKPPPIINSLPLEALGRHLVFYFGIEARWHSRTSVLKSSQEQILGRMVGGEIVQKSCKILENRDITLNSSRLTPSTRNTQHKFWHKVREKCVKKITLFLHNNLNFFELLSI
jgi:hypothetical protein